MKRVYIICLFLAGFLGIGAYLYSYRYFVQAGREEAVTGTSPAVSLETVEAVAKEEIRLTKDTQYYVETYDIEKNTIIREPSELPTEAIGSSRKQFADYLENMLEQAVSKEQEEGLLSIELMDFTSQEVVVRKTYKEPKKECEFYLDVQMGRVIVRNADDSLYAYTEIKFETLPEDLKREILHGFAIENLEELYEFLETYSS